MTLQDTTHSLWRTFDSAWYRQTYPIADGMITAGQCPSPIGVYKSLVRPLQHSPNLFFNESWYLGRYKGVRDAVANGSFKSGFDHYCRHGGDHFAPHWLFDPIHYRSSFQRAYGRDFDPARDGHPYDHFLEIGQHQDLAGHWLVDPAVYMATAAFDVVSRIVRFGFFTTLLFHIDAVEQEPIVSSLFDPARYKARYPRVAREIAEKKWSCALHHYLGNDDPTVFDPSPNFSEQAYLKYWPDVAAAVRNGSFRNGFAHFILHGRKERRFFVPATTDETAEPVPTSRGTIVTASFPLRTRTFDTVTFLPCEPDPECPTGTRFAVMGPDRKVLAAFDHPWLTMKPGDGAAAAMPGSFIYGGVLVSHFGHILRDGLAGLWFIRQHPELPILWHWLDLPVPHSTWPTWLDEIWRILGLDRHTHHIIKTPVTVDRVILPDSSLMAPNVLHRTQARALARLAPAMALTGDRVWLSRSRLPGEFGCFLREDEVEAILAARGWRIVHPQEHMVAEQVDIFATAAIVAGPVGSAFHAVLLSTAPRAKLILVQRPGIERTFHDAVARALDLEQYCLDPDLEPFSESHPWARFTLADPSGLADMVCHLADVVAG